MGVPILKHGGHLIATLQEDVGDDDLVELMRDISALIGRTRARGVVLDVSELDVLDSYGTRTLRTIAHTTRLRGAATVIVGIQPEVAFAMVQLGLQLDGISTALDLEAGIELLDREIQQQGAAA
jgi:rsbT antagonist protein RsbS